jgi:hypothetical protein
LRGNSAARGGVRPLEGKITVDLPGRPRRRHRDNVMKFNQILAVRAIKRIGACNLDTFRSIIGLAREYAI